MTEQFIEWLYKVNEDNYREWVKDVPGEHELERIVRTSKCNAINSVTTEALAKAFELMPEADWEGIAKRRYPNAQITRTKSGLLIEHEMILDLLERK